jgi:probable F420-dependent oxidoreductase
MKIRIGIGLGAGASGGRALATIVDPLVDFGFDSIWLSEVLTGDVADPLIGLAWLGARYPTLKLGTTMLLPGRNPLRLAKETATLDRLTDGRLLLTLVPGLAQAPEAGAIGIPTAARSKAIEETLPLLRRLWAGEEVTYHGQGLDLEGVTLRPLPVQQPLEPWLGGMAPAALRRCGRLADGWLPSLCTPEEAAAGKAVIDAAAAEAGRQVDPEHFGVSIGYRVTAPDERTRQAIATRARGNPVDAVLPVGLPALRDLMDRFVGVGFTKFVVRPLEPVDDWAEELGQLAKAVGDLQT